MRTGRTVSIVLAMAMASMACAGDAGDAGDAGGAGDFDGSKPLTCTADKGYDCLPGAESCGPLKPETDIAPIYDVDFAKKEVRSPFRASLLKIVNSTSNRDALVLQGADGTAAWSATVDRKTGELTVALADSQGAYVVFGQCKVTAAK